MQPLKRVAITRLCEKLGRNDSYFTCGLVKGFSLCGNIPPCGRWTPKVVKSECTLGEWAAQAGRMRNMILGRTSSAGAELDKKLWQITMEEQERGWLEGPFDS
eukprot:6490639-Amphidinium_carterae.2